MRLFGYKTVGSDIIRPKAFPFGARLSKRVQWTKQRARLGAAVKNFKANAVEIFGHRKRTVDLPQGKDG